MEEIEEVAKRLARRFIKEEEIYKEAIQLVWEFYLEYPHEVKSHTNPRLLKKLSKDLGLWSRFYEVIVEIKNNDGSDVTNALDLISKTEDTPESMLLAHETPSIEEPETEVDPEAVREARAHYTWTEELIHKLKYDYGYRDNEAASFLGFTRKTITSKRYEHKVKLLKDKINYKETRVFVKWIKIRLK